MVGVAVLEASVYPVPRRDYSQGLPASSQYVPHPLVGASVLDPRPALVEVLGTEVVVRDPRLVLEAAVLGTAVLGTMGVLVVLVHLGEDLVEISLEAAAEADHSAALAVVAGSRLPVDRVRRDPPGMGDVATVLRAYLPDSENLEWGTPVQS